MTQIALIGVGAGAAAALLFGSVTSGIGFSVILFYLAPLPIMIVAAGWSHWAGLTAAVAAAAMLGGVFGILFFAIFLASVGALAMFGGDEATIRRGLKGALDQLLRLQTGSPADAPLRVPGIEDADRVVEMLVSALPPTAAVITAITLTGNLWLAGLIVRLSGRLTRPWPDLAMLSFPPLATAIYGALLAGAFLPDLAGLVAGLFAATLTMAFALIGFA